jgi:hypothetical protein
VSLVPYTVSPDLLTVTDGENPYYNNNGAGGGGFVSGGSPYGSQAESPGGKAKGKGNSTIRPVTIRQVLGAQQAHPDADFTIDGVEIGQVSDSLLALKNALASPCDASSLSLGILGM